MKMCRALLGTVRAPCCSPALPPCLSGGTEVSCVGGGCGGCGRNRLEGSPSPLFSCPTRESPMALLTVHIGRSSEGACVPPPWPVGLVPAAKNIFTSRRARSCAAIGGARPWRRSLAGYLSECVFARLARQSYSCEYACSQPTQSHQRLLVGAGGILVWYGVPRERFTAFV